MSEQLAEQLQTSSTPPVGLSRFLLPAKKPTAAGFRGLTISALGTVRAHVPDRGCEMPQVW